MTTEDIKKILLANRHESQELFAKAVALRNKTIGDGVYLRGLLEYSNICRKNCLYCGIRSSMDCERYELSDEQVIDAARFAYESNYGSMVLQSGENSSKEFVDKITKLVKEIKRISSNKLGITLSLGEQSYETYRRWFDAGAHRYLLRIETSDKQLYKKLHPNDAVHDFNARLEALYNIRRAGYQVGSGVMIGLPYQTMESMVNDLLFLQELDIDMCGMGPYIVSSGTPLATQLKISDAKELHEMSNRDVESGYIYSEKFRLELTYRMIAALRLLMPDINIAATTALQAIDPMGRVNAIEAGANVIMPNISPNEVRENYFLYDNKPLDFDSHLLEGNIRYGEWGDSLRFKNRRQ